MSDAPLVEQPVIKAAEAAPGTSVSDVLLEQVDQKVAAIETEQARLQPVQQAVVTAQTDLQNIQAAAAKSTNPSVKEVYERAIVVAQQLILSVQMQGQEVADHISALQDELEKLLGQLREQDPENPLVKDL